MSCTCTHDLKAPTVVDFRLFLQFIQKATETVRKLYIDQSLEPQPSSIIASDGIVSVMFAETDKRYIAVLDDGSAGVITQAEISEDESLITISLLAESGDFSPLLVLDVISTSAGYFLRESDNNEVVISSAKDCAQCILDKCGNCGGCAAWIPNWPFVAGCLLKCAAVCAATNCWRKCH
jgi:hypothetical protein